MEATLRRDTPNPKERPLVRKASPETIAAHAAALRHPRVANLAVRDVFVGALRLYRREPFRVSVSAVVLLAPGLIMGVGSGAYIDRIQEETLERSHRRCPW